MPIGVAVTNPAHPDHGRLVRHRRDGRSGTISGQLVERDGETGKLLGHRIFVRPVGGGIEWEAAPADLQLVGEHPSNGAKRR
ncbi:hypothetical protein [Kitasatospora cinereorecta]|uniref:Transposase n=1 Tax=Kitasatospora cinereorecta TaxID=285560 RepID=A0ABW0VP84_9ACTN